MAKINEQIDNMLTQGPVQSLIRFNYYNTIYNKIAQNAQDIATCKSKGVIAKLQTSSYESMILHCCKIYEKFHSKFKKRTFEEIIDIIRINKKNIEILNEAVLEKYCSNEYDINSDFLIPSCEPTINRDLVVKLCKSIKNNLPHKKRYDKLSRSYYRVERLRSKVIAHNDISPIDEMPKYQDIQYLMTNATEIVSVLSQVFFGAFPILTEEALDTEKEMDLLLSNILQNEKQPC